MQSEREALFYHKVLAAPDGAVDGADIGSVLQHVLEQNAGALGTRVVLGQVDHARHDGDGPEGHLSRPLRAIGRRENWNASNLTS